MPRGRQVLGRSCLAAAMLAAGGCSAYDPHLVASWYAVHASRPATNDAASQQAETSDRRLEGVYVAILNRGPRMRLYTMRMNGQRGELVAFIESKAAEGSRDLGTGEILILEAGELRDSSCRPMLPVSLQITTRPRGRPRQVRVEGTMPTALPDEWLEPCSPPS